jgi:hypothetical protein
MMGGHLMRRKGQSLEFRDFDNYQRGDDIRYVDWRASARYGRQEDLLVKNFVAEEQLRVFISLDNRASMLLPEAMPKMQYALWIAEALGIMTASYGDQVTIHRLFGRSNAGLVKLRRRSPALGHRQREMLTEVAESDADINLQPTKKHLPPTAIWIIISDYYFDDDHNSLALANTINRAQDGMRWIILLDIDSWPHEKAVLGRGSRKIDGPELGSAKAEYDLDEDAYAELDARIQSHKDQFFNQIGRGTADYSPWKWPEEPTVDHAEYFYQRFFEDRLIQRIFMRDK